MTRYFDDLKKYGVTLGLTTGFLWLIGGLLGSYFSSREALLFISALVVGGLPVFTTLMAVKFNITGALLLIIEALSLLFIVYMEGSSIFMLIIIAISYSLPIAISGVIFIMYRYKKETRI